MLHEGFNIVDILKGGISAYTDIEVAKAQGGSGANRITGTPAASQEQENFVEKSKVWVVGGAVIVVLIVLIMVTRK